MVDYYDAPADKQSQFYCVKLSSAAPCGQRLRCRYQNSGGGYSVASYILSFLRKERLGEKGGAFLKGKEGRVGFRKMLFAIHPLIILLILPRSNMIHPFLVLEIPLHRFFYTLLKLERWLQTDFLLEFARINGITPIVTLSISKVGLQYFFVQK